MTLKIFICLIYETEHSGAYQEDNQLEQGPSDLPSHTLLCLFEGGTNVSTSWLRKSFSQDSSQGGPGPISFFSSFKKVIGLCTDTSLPLPLKARRPFMAALAGTGENHNHYFTPSWNVST